MKDSLNINDGRLISKVKIANIIGKNYFKSNKTNITEMSSEKIESTTQYDEKNYNENTTTKTHNNNEELSIRSKSLNFNENVNSPKYKSISKKKANFQNKININYFSQNKKLKNLNINKNSFPRRLNTISTTKEDNNECNFNLCSISDFDPSQTYRINYKSNDNIINKDSGIDDILNLNNKIKINENNDLLSNMVEIPEEDMHINDNIYFKSAQKTQKSNISQSNIILNSETPNKKFNTIKSKIAVQFNKNNLRRINSNLLAANKLNIKNRSSFVRTNQRKYIKKNSNNINNNFIVNSSDNLFENKKNNLYKNKPDYNSSNFKKKFELVVKESINAIELKKKYEKLIKKLKEDIEVFNQKKLNEEETLKKLRNTEISKFRKQENEIFEKQNYINSKHSECYEEIQKLMEIKKNLEIEMNTREKNNNIYLNLLQKKLEDSYKINNDLQMKLQLYKNMIDNEKDNLLINIENENENDKIKVKAKENNISKREIKSYIKKPSKIYQNLEKKFTINLTEISNSNLNSINNNMLTNNTKNNNSQIKKVIKIRKVSEYTTKTLKIDDYISSSTSSTKKLNKSKKNVETSPKEKNSKFTNIKLSDSNLKFINEKVAPYKRQKSDKKINYKVINTRYSNCFGSINDSKDKDKKIKRNISKANFKNKSTISNTTITNNKFKVNNLRKSVINNCKLKNSDNKKNGIKHDLKNSLTKSTSNLYSHNKITINKIIKPKNIFVNKIDSDNDENYDLVFPPKYHSPSNKNLKIINISYPGNGKTITEYENHKKVISFGKIGLKKEIYPDGYQINYFKNKDIKQIFPNGKEVYFYSKNNSISIKLPNGTKIVKFQNGQIEKYMPDGSKVIKYSDGIKRNVNQYGSEEILNRDGLTQKKDKNGIVSNKYL